MPPRRLTTLLSAAVVLALPLQAGPFANADWRRRQELAVTQPGLVRVALPVETLEAARPDLADLRLVDPAGGEMAFALERTELAPWRLRAPESQAGTVEDDATVFVLQTGTDDRIAGLEIDAGQQSFLTRATVEAADDGQTWRLLGRHLPLYDRGGQLRALQLDFPPGSYPYLRLTLDRLNGRHIALRRISLLTHSAQADESEPVAVRVTARDETPGETRLVLALPGANLQLATLELTTPEPVFNRPVRLVYRAFAGETIREVTLAERAIVRPTPFDRPGAGAVSISVERAVPLRELILVVNNGDSPPLALPGVAARRRPVFAVFFATTAGPHLLYVGNPRAVPPRYDVGALTGESRAVPPLSFPPGPVGPNPGFHPGEPLPEIPALGAPLEVSPWAWRKPVQLGAAGVQQLELDPAVLADAQRDLSDLRLMSDGRQVPFIVERTSLLRPLAVMATPAPEAKRPQLSRWRLGLPRPRLPLVRVSAAVSTPLFQRQMRLYEDLEDDRGSTARRWLGEATWSQTPGRRTAVFSMTLNQAPETDTLWLETDNGDNPPITFGEVRAYYAATRLLFKTATESPVFLHFGNPRAATPRYDLSLVGAQLLATDKAVAVLGAGEAMKGSSFADAMTVVGRGGIPFWGMLGLVVIVLLVVIARLLPKAPPVR
jgi:hypothetical protein